MSTQKPESFFTKGKPPHQQKPSDGPTAKSTMAPHAAKNGRSNLVNGKSDGDNHKGGTSQVSVHRLETEYSKFKLEALDKINRLEQDVAFLKKAAINNHTTQGVRSGETAHDDMSGNKTSNGSSESTLQDINADHSLPDQRDTPRRSIEDACLEQNPRWQPLAIRQMSPLAADALAKIPSSKTMETFSWELLQENFGGVQHSPGFYFVPPDHGPCVLPQRTYYVIDPTYELFLPKAPGMHGAKLTAFFNDLDDDMDDNAYDNVPLFVAVNSHLIHNHHQSSQSDDVSTRATPETQEPEPDISIEYVYMGTYTQSRYSDVLDYDRLQTQVPDEVKMYWAEQLSDEGKPEWLTEKLMKHFFPKPEYIGRMPSERDSNYNEKKVKQDIAEYVEELQAWQKEAKMKVSLMTRDVLLQAFQREDCNDPRGLRLWWEYLECVGWDMGFYNMLLKLKARANTDRK